MGQEGLSMTDEDFDALLKRVTALEKLTGIGQGRKKNTPKLTCPNGHGDEDLRIDQYSTGQTRYTCMACEIQPNLAYAPLAFSGFGLAG
jgi:predicted SprT family Zn-dependent metalloprotease